MPNANGGSITYRVSNMRFVLPSGKVAEKNPDRIGTVHGEFHSIDAKGNVSKEPLTFSSKEITRELAANPLTSINIEAGTLTLPAGERGRRASAGVDQDAVNALLAAARTASESGEAAPAE